MEQNKTVNKAVVALPIYGKLTADMSCYNMISVMIYSTLCYHAIYILVSVVLQGSFHSIYIIMYFQLQFMSWYNSVSFTLPFKFILNVIFVLFIAMT